MIALIILIAVALTISTAARYHLQPYRIALTTRGGGASQRTPYVSLIPRWSKATYNNGVFDVSYSYDNHETFVSALTQVKEAQRALVRARKGLRRG